MYKVRYRGRHQRKLDGVVAHGLDVSKHHVGFPVWRTACEGEAALQLMGNKPAGTRNSRPRSFRCQKKLRGSAFLGHLTSVN